MAPLCHFCKVPGAVGHHCPQIHPHLHHLLGSMHCLQPLVPLSYHLLQITCHCLCEVAMLSPTWTYL
jgi:hypothetical protein